MAKRIGILVESYYRNPSPNGICTKVIADELVDQGHEVTIFTSKRGFNQPKFEEVNGTIVKRVNRSLAYILRNVSEYYKGKKGKVADFASKVLFKINSTLKFFVWPLHSVILIFKYMIAVNNTHNQKRYDVIIGVYLHLEEVLAAIIIKQKHPEIKLIIYTLDAMTGRTVPKLYGTNIFTKKSIKFWEHYVYSKADVICVMESHRDHYNQPYYNEIRHKLKYMDIPYLKIRETKTSEIKRNKKVIIAYTGFSSKVTGDPFYFLETLKNLNNIEFHMYGARSKDVEKFIEESGLLNEVVFLHGRMQHEEIINIQQSADFLVNFGSDNSCMVPSKIFEYIANKKPIISFYKIDNDASYPYIIKYPNSILIKEDMNLLSENIESLNRFIFSKTYESISDEFLLENYYNNTPYPMVDEILSK